eukprot:m.208913 g.208913  ORF g.208913 m.208913 type:complete len:206 (+) comp26093_c2_seq4:112-729(+)
MSELLMMESKDSSPEVNEKAPATAAIKDTDQVFTHKSTHKNRLLIAGFVGVICIIAIAIVLSITLRNDCSCVHEENPEFMYFTGCQQVNTAMYTNFRWSYSSFETPWSSFPDAGCCDIGNQTSAQDNATPQQRCLDDDYPDDYFILEAAADTAGSSSSSSSSSSPSSSRCSSSSSSSSGAATWGWPSSSTAKSSSWFMKSSSSSS